MAKKGKKPAAQPSKLRKSANTASESTKSGSSKPRRKASTLFLTREEEKKPEGWLASSYNTASKWYTNTTKTKTYTGLNGGVRWLGTKAKKKVWGGVEKPPMEKGLDNARYYYNYVMGTDATTQAKSGKKKQRRGATRTEGSTVETETMTQQTKPPTVHVALEPSSFYETPPVGPPPTHYPPACGSDYPPSSRDSKPNLPPRPPGSWPDMSDEKSHKPRLPDHFHDYHHSQPAPSYQDSSFDRLYNGPTETCSRYAESRPPPARAYRSDYHERPMPPLPHRSGSSWDTDRYGAEEEDYARPPPLPPRPSRPPKDTHRHYSHSQYSRRPSSRDTEYSNNESYYSSPPPRSRSSHRAPPRLPPADWDGHRPSTYPSSHHGRARSVRHASWASGSWDEELPPPYQVTEKHSSWAPESIGGRGHATSDRSTGRQLSTRPSSRVPVTKHSRGPRQLRYQADTEEPPRGRSRTRKASRGPSDRSRSTSVASSQAASRPRRLHSSASAAASRIPKR